MSKATQGHLLVMDGLAALKSNGKPNKWPYPANGCARCTCGETSAELNSNRRRRAWHRDHLIELKKLARTEKAKANG